MATASTATTGVEWGATMDVALKIWRFNPESVQRELRRYEVDAPERGCILDVVCIIKDCVGGTLA